MAPSYSQVRVYATFDIFTLALAVHKYGRMTTCV